MSRRRDARRGGFTLIEVMAAMMIFLLGVVGILALFTTALAVHRDASDRTLVALAADDVRARVERWLAEAGAGAEGSLPDELPETPLPGQPHTFYAATFAADPEAGMQGGVLATVRVVTVDAGRRREETFTLFCRPRAAPADLIRKAKREIER